MIIGVPREVQAEERRVALVPDIVGKLKGLGFEVLVEVGAGAAASFPDELYREAGAELVDDPSAIWERSDWIVKVREPLRHPKLRKQETGLLREGQILTALLAPGQNPDLLKKLARQKVTALALEAVPRITRAQSMDVLSSMANISGYRAVIEGANHFGRFFTGQSTAAGKIPPAKVLVIGAGVAGLSAIGTAQHLGAIVRAFDTRPAVKDEVHSMGADTSGCSAKVYSSSAGLSQSKHDWHRSKSQLRQPNMGEPGDCMPSQRLHQKWSAGLKKR